MKLIVAIGWYALGVPATVKLIFMNIAGWKINLLMIFAVTWWSVEIARAFVRLYFEIKEKKIELKEKESRYSKDIFT